MGRWTLIVIVATAAIACAGSRPPTYQLTQSKSAVRGASEVGARDTPKAALHLKMANDQIIAAEDLILSREYDRARHLLIRAEADANLAIALANEAKARADADDAKRKLQKLREETE